MIVGSKEVSRMGWQVLADTRDLSQKHPRQFFLKGRPWVVVPTKEGYRVFEDRCPHRQYPLSKGILRDDGKLQCAYHGWVFDQNGILEKRPGYDEAKTPEYCLPHLKTKLVGGLLFVRDPAEAEDTQTPQWMRDLDDPEWNSFRYSKAIKARPIAVIENLLDPFHTHFIHQPFLRADSDRHNVDVDTRYESKNSTLELVYTGEPTPTGLISRLFEKERVKTVGRYLGHDNVTVLEYWTPKGLDLRVTLVVSEPKSGETQGSLIFQVPKTWMPFGLVRPLYRFLTGFLVRQDFAALEVQEQTWLHFPDKPIWISQQDYVYKVIQKIQTGGKVDDFHLQYRLKI